jgi:phosphoadenosine phosphosulfate reductase
MKIMYKEIDRNDIAELGKAFTGREPAGIISIASDLAGRDEIVFASSLSAEDQVITHLISDGGFGIRTFTLDTGRLHEETYELIDITGARYGKRIEIYFPDPKLVEAMVEERGVNLFYKSVEDRKRCCRARKLEPLKRALGKAKIWITGLRREHSITRGGIGPVETDEANGLIKVNPLYDWSSERLWNYIRTHNIPYNPLHDRGFASIGCAPCTRAVVKGEDMRSGRWWWESPDKRECGLHRKDKT